MVIIKNLVLLLKAQGNEEKQDKYEVVLTEKGYDVMQVNTLDFQYKKLDSLGQKLEHPEFFAGIIFSSPRCVLAVKHALRNSELLDEWKLKSNYVVGEGTYEIALKELVLQSIGKDTGNANNLADLLLNDDDNNEKMFLYPHGNLKMDILKSKLAGSNLKLEEVEAYETISNKEIESEFIKKTDSYKLNPQYIVFFSPSGVRAVMGLLHNLPLQQIKTIAIGPTTKKCMIEAGISVSATADQPTPQGILKAMTELEC